MIDQEMLDAFLDVWLRAKGDQKPVALLKLAELQLSKLGNKCLGRLFTMAEWAKLEEQIDLIVEAQVALRKINAVTGTAS